MGAAHLDTITKLVAPARHGRTNPVHRTYSRPGGVACNIAAALARLGCPVTLFCPPPPTKVSHWLRAAGIQQRRLGTTAHGCSYTAVLDPAGELELGLADMADYDRMGKKYLPPSFPGRSRTGIAILDAAFKPALHRAAARQAQQAGWLVCGQATSPAKVMRLVDIPFDLFVLNETEAQVLTNQQAPATQLARTIAATTGGWVAVTQGSKGACLAADDKMHTVKPTQPRSSNTTGAGDAFTAALIAALSAARAAVWSPAQALEFAVATGSAHARRKTRNNG